MTTRRKILVACAALVILGALIFVILLRTGLVPASGDFASGVSVVCPGAPQQAIDTTSVIGFPAITPRNTCTPSFTAQDVRDYVQKNPRLLENSDAAPVTITRVEFMTARQASQLLGGEGIGLAESAIVCYLQLSGTFYPYSSPPGATVQASPSATVIFDAHDGNILIEGT